MLSFTGEACDEADERISVSSDSFSVMGVVSVIVALRSACTAVSGSEDIPVWDKFVVSSALSDERGIGAAGCITPGAFVSGILSFAPT